MWYTDKIDYLDEKSSEDWLCNNVNVLDNTELYT